MQQPLQLPTATRRVKRRRGTSRKPSSTLSNQAAPTVRPSAETKRNRRPRSSGEFHLDRLSPSLPGTSTHRSLEKVMKRAEKGRRGPASLLRYAVLNSAMQSTEQGEWPSAKQQAPAKKVIVAQPALVANTQSVNKALQLVQKKQKGYNENLRQLIYNKWSCLNYSKPLPVISYGLGCWCQKYSDGFLGYQS